MIAVEEPEEGKEKTAVKRATWNHLTRAASAGVSLVRYLSPQAGSHWPRKSDIIRWLELMSQDNLALYPVC